MTKAIPENPYMMVAAIDFGTTFSCYAFSFRGSETDIRMNNNWGDVFGFASYKTPTTVLLKGRSLEFEAFGYEAEEKYTEMADGDESSNAMHLYRHFKMLLHNSEKLTTKTVLCSTDGQIIPAIDVFTHALRYLRDHLLNELSKELSSAPDPGKIHWVITVPVIWTEDSKQFMREAAFRSGCITERNSRQVSIALEPEAASFYCRELDLAKFAGKDTISFSSGTRYLVLDCGGGTNDMVVHEVVLENKVKELIAVTGGAYGGSSIDGKFISLLKQILGKQFIEEFSAKCPNLWVRFLLKFEQVKKNANNDSKTKINIEMPYEMERLYSVINPNQSLKDAFSTENAEGTKFANGILTLYSNIIKSLFEETVEGIVGGVQAIYFHPEVKPLKYILMVGGLSHSPFLQSVMKEKFGSTGCRILVPSEAQMAIVKGAVLFGHDQDQVITRIARKTYGVIIRSKFDPELHDPLRKYSDDDGNEKCKVFVPLIEKDEEIRVGERRKYKARVPANRNGANVAFMCLTRKPNKPVEYHDSPDISTLGVLQITKPDDDIGTAKYYTAYMTFGRTEILAEVVDKATGKQIEKVSLDFLCDKR